MAIAWNIGRTLVSLNTEMSRINCISKYAICDAIVPILSVAFILWRKGEYCMSAIIPNLVDWVESFYRFAHLKITQKTDFFNKLLFVFSINTYTLFFNNMNLVSELEASAWIFKLLIQWSSLIPTGILRLYLFAFRLSCDNFK